MKKRLVSGIMAAALAIVPFTGTGIKAVDKVFDDSTTITASASYAGAYVVKKPFYLDGHYLSKNTFLLHVDDNGYYSAWGKSYYIIGYYNSGYLFKW